MKYKIGVSADGVQPQTWYMLGVADGVYNQFGCKLVVTSLTDGVHPDPKNIHGRGFAADLRISGIAADTVDAIVHRLQALLFPLGYDIVLESDHIHGEYDPKPGRDSWTAEVA